MAAMRDGAGSVAFAVLSDLSGGNALAPNPLQAQYPISPFLSAHTDNASDCQR